MLNTIKNNPIQASWQLAQASILNRHWGVGSETFTGGDALFAMLERGWSVSGAVACQQFTVGALPVSGFCRQRGQQAGIFDSESHLPRDGFQ